VVISATSPKSVVPAVRNFIKKIMRMKYELSFSTKNSTGNWDLDDYSSVFGPGKAYKKWGDEQQRRSSSSGYVSATILFGGLLGLVLASLVMVLLAAKIYRRRISRRIMERFLREYARHSESSEGKLFSIFVFYDPYVKSSFLLYTHFW